MLRVTIRGTFLQAACQYSHIHEQTSKANVLLIGEWERHHFFVTIYECREKLERKQFAIAHVKMPQVIPAICSTNFSKVNDTSVTPIILVNLGCVEVSVSKISLLAVQPGVVAGKYSFQACHF